MIRLHLSGTVRDAETGVGVSGLYVKAYDEDLLYDDLLGSAVTDRRGRFEITSEGSDFREFFEKDPEVYLKVFGPDRETLLYESEDSVRVGAGDAIGAFDVRVPHEALGDHTPERRLQLIGDDGTPREDFDVGESLAIELDGLRPETAHEIVVSVDGDERFTGRLLSDENGSIPRTTVWPQMGLEGDEDELLTVEEARERWSGRTVGLEVRADETVLYERSFEFPDRFERPLVVPVDDDGRVRNGFEVGEADAVVHGVNVPFDGEARGYIVGPRGDWRPGDPFEPVTLADGTDAVAEIEIEDGEFTARLASADALEPGAYDFLVRNVRYGYEDAETFRVRESDLVTRSVTGLVVREAFQASKPIVGSCVNTQPISGRQLSTSPYFDYADTFQLGEDVWGALDPNGLDPNLVGKMTAFYVVEHKTESGWSSDPSLDHLPVLGGDSNVIVARTQPTCINANDFLLWPSASQTGEYDIVADFGNDTPDPASFVTDETFDPPTDVVDGYYRSGFRVIEDPTTETSFAHAGSFEYNEGPVTVTDGSGGTVTVDEKAVVYFPADAPGQTQPSGISTAQSDYPVVVVVHGNSGALNSYRGYDYLLEHLARNGFIAASYHMRPNMGGVDRAELLFEHLDTLQTRFGTAMRNEVGAMGHSRGGEAVAIVPRLNHQGGHGWNIEAVVSLAPTDQYTSETIDGAWATPYLVIYGSLDGDVAGGWGSPMNTGFALYDRAADEVKSMVFVYGATHGRFNTVWGDVDLGFGKIGPGEAAAAISMDVHQKILKGYATGFFRQHLLGEDQFRGAFTGDWVPAAVEAADGGSVELYTQYQDTSREVVDDFEEAHTATSWQSSAIGGTVDDSNTLPSDPTEDELYDVDSHSPHDTSGLALEWDGTTDELRFTVPPGHRDVRSYDAVSFRVTQTAGSPANPPGEQDLYLAMEDGDGTIRKVKASAFGTIPEPFDRYHDQYTKSAMTTVRVPLAAFVIKVPGPDSVRLDDVRDVTFEFEREPTGEIQIDSVEFTD